VFGIIGSVLVRMSSFLRDYLTVVWFGAAALALGGLLLGIAAIVRPFKPTPAKLIAYESGVDPVGTGWSQSQIRYYVFALLFVIFDVEAVFIFPYAASVERYGAFGLIVMLAFIILLLDGLLYAWKRGLLRWV
jgi:NADH-quinone oxidoreductase subunit A